MELPSARKSRKTDKGREIPKHKDLIVELVEIDNVIANSHPVYGKLKGDAPVIRIFGRTLSTPTQERGLSVCVFIHGFLPYTFVESPKDFNFKGLSLLKKKLESSAHVSIYSLEIVSAQSVMGYRPEDSQFVKITITTPKDIPKLRNVISEGVKIEGFSPFPAISYESNLEFVLRFMIDCELSGFNWFKIDKDLYEESSGSDSTCGCEVSTSWDSLQVLKDFEENARFKILSFDIECDSSKKGVFPDPTRQGDHVITIANRVCELTRDGCQVIENRVYQLKSCDAVKNAKLHTFEKGTTQDQEKEMLLAWRNFIIDCDPDIITGYNTTGFDMPYLVKRARTLKIDKVFSILGRMRTEKSTIIKQRFESKAYGKQDSEFVRIPGRLQFDPMVIIKRDFKLRSYSLNSVSAIFLGDQKEDVHYSDIGDLFNGPKATSSTRHRLASYCLKDAILPIKIIDKKLLLVNYIELTRVCGPPLSMILQKGQQIRVIFQLYRKTSKNGYLIPFNSNSKGGNDQDYEGAEVIDPERGYHDDKVVTLDFARLYPSIMCAHNLCYTTLLTKEQANSMPPENYEVIEVKDTETHTRILTTFYFLRKSVKEGILPIILEELHKKRSEAKNEMAAAKKNGNKGLADIMDGKQNALKISTNSVYGFTGATYGKLPCLAIARCVTALGRQMITQTKSIVESEYKGSRVIYGDTDSVMVIFGPLWVNSLEDAIHYGKDAVAKVNKVFPPPVSLEFEKVLWPYLLVNKKRYAGLYWTKPTGYDFMLIRGLESVRRDNCLLTKETIDSLLSIVMRKDTFPKYVQGETDVPMEIEDISKQEATKRIKENASALVKTTLSNLLTDKVDLSKLVISKAYSKDESDYVGRQIHIELVKKMQKRDAGSAPCIGERIPYVMIRGRKGSKNFQNSEDPIYVLVNGIPIDTDYYVNNQLKKPILRIMEPLIGRKAENLLFQGDHMRHRVIVQSQNYGIAMFAKPVLRCLSEGCNAIVSPEENLVCKSCTSKKIKVAEFQLEKLHLLENETNKLLDQCQRCQGSTEEEVICKSRECPIFYRRTRVKMDLGKQKTLVETRVSLNW